tara:strand:+ start:1137 stop:1838 length:702 start_codon:yes stop_codon:yes gene_type:complete
MINDIINVFKNLPSNHLHHTLITIVVIATLLIVRYRVNRYNLNFIDIFLGFLPIIIELIFQIQSVLNKEWMLIKTLPLEISYLTIFAIPIYLFMPSRILQSWIYYIGIWSAAAAFLNTIMMGAEPWHVLLRYYGHHGTLLYFGISIYISGYRPTLNDYYNTAKIMLLIIFIIGLINMIIGSNYMFTRFKPTGMNLTLLMADWPYYFIIIVSIGLVFCYLLYLIGKDKLHKPVK